MYKSLFLIILLLLGAYVAVEQVFSKEIALYFINRNLKEGKVDASSVSLKIFSGSQKLEGVSYNSFDTTTHITAKVITLEAPLTVLIAGKRPFKCIVDALSAEVQYLGSKAHLEDARMELALEPDWLSDGVLFRELIEAADNMQANIVFNDMPTAVITKIPGIPEVLAKNGDVILGTSLSGQGAVNLFKGSGPIDLQLQSDFFQMTLKGRVDNGILTLTSPFTSSLALNPDSARKLFKKSIPVLATVQGSSSPLKLVISPEGFSANIRQLNQEHITIAQGVLDLEVLEFATGSTLQQLLNVFLNNDHNDFTLWFTPIYFSFNRGEVLLQRADILIANQYPVAVWGRLNTVQNTINMTLGISGTAIAKAFRVSGIGSKEMVQVPLRGALNNPEIDKKAATAAITSKQLQNQTGLPGVILTSVLNAATGNAADAIPPAPQPTTDPLPWSNMEGLQDKPPKTEVLPAPVQQIQKGATKIFKNLLGLD